MSGIKTKLPSNILVPLDGQNDIAMGFMRPKTLQTYLNMGGIPLSRSAVSELQKRPDPQSIQALLHSRTLQSHRCLQLDS